MFLKELVLCDLFGGNKRFLCIDMEFVLFFWITLEEVSFLVGRYIWVFS